MIGSGIGGIIVKNLSEVDAVVLEFILSEIERMTGHPEYEHEKLADERYRLDLAYSRGRRSVTDDIRLALKRKER